VTLNFALFDKNTFKEAETFPFSVHVMEFPNSYIVVAILLVGSIGLAKSSVPPIDTAELYNVTGRSVGTARMSRIGIYQDKVYFVDTTSRTWDEAKRACESSGTALVSVESTGELTYLKSIVSSSTTYWTSGKTANSYQYDTGATTASVSVSSPTCLSITRSGGLIAETCASKFVALCQGTSVIVPCYATNDLVVVLDSSGSVGAANYVTAKSFVVQLATAFTVNAPSRFSLIAYSSTAIVTIPLNNGMSPTQINTAINNHAYQAGGTGTASAIHAAINQITSSNRNVPKNIVVLTDGQSNSQAQTIAAANTAYANNIRTFSVGITPNVNYAELLGIARNNVNRVFTRDSFPDLIKILAPLCVRVCEN